MPRRSKLLPYLQLSNVGRLTDKRTIPVELQEFAGGLRIFSRALGLKSTDPKDPRVIKAWSVVHEEAEKLLEQARTTKEGHLISAKEKTSLSA